MSNTNEDRKIIKSQIQLSFSKKGLKFVSTEVERFADNSTNTHTVPDHFNFENVDEEHVLQVKKALLVQVAEFLGLKREDANSAFPIINK